MLKVKKIIVGLFLVLFFSALFITLSYADENAAEYYLKASNLLSDISQDSLKNMDNVIRNSWKEDNQELKELLVKNQEAIEEFKKATQIPYCDFSFGKSIVKNISSDAPQHVNDFRVAKIIILEGKLHEKQGQIDLALGNYFSVLRFIAHLGQQKDFILISKIAEIILEKLACDSLLEYVKSVKLTIPGYKQLFDTLISFQKRKVGLGNAFEEEKEFRKNSIRLFETIAQKKGKYNENFYQIFYEEYDKLEDEFIGYMITAFKDNDPEFYEAKIKQLESDKIEEEARLSFKVEPFASSSNFADWLGSWERINSPSLAAKSCFLTGVPTYSKVITRYYNSISRLNILIVVTAIKLYELTNDNTIGSLEELIPAYFKKIPEDPFDNFKPLKFEKKNTGFVVYSFGPNKLDDYAGLKIDEEAKDLAKIKGDIVFQAF